MSQPLLSILIVNYHGLPHLEECLGGIFAQDFRDFEVVMVDNASADGSVEFVRERFPLVKVVQSGANLGFAGGNNHGLPHCRGRFVFFLNNDTALEAGALEALALAISGNPAVKVFAPFLVNYRERHLADSAGDCVYNSGSVFSFSHYPVSMFTQRRFVCSPCGGAAVYAREVLDRIGAFDEDFFLNFEDLDLGYRAQHAGEKVLFLPEVMVYHKGSATLGGKRSALSTYYAERNFPLFVLKNFPAANLVRFIPALLFVKAMRLVTMIIHGGVGAYFRGTWDGLKLVPRMLPKRKAIQSSSKLTYDGFDALIRKHWLRERLAYRKGRFDIPL
jgi:GT2 family glycosyltransferase